MNNPLPYIIATLTQNDRQLVIPGVDFEWSSKSWSHNIFRLLELMFGRKAGVRFEAATYLSESGEIIRIFGTMESIVAHMETVLRGYLNGLKPAFRFIPAPVFAMPNGMTIPSSPFMFAIAFDAAATFDNGSGHATSFSYSHTCTGSNLTLVSEGYMNEAGAPTVTSITYNSVTMSNGVTNIAGNQNTFIYYLAAPSTGANNIIITPSKSCIASFGSMSFTGTAASPAGATGTNSSGGSTTPNTSVTTTAANSWVVDFIQLDGTTGALTATTTGTGQTSRFTNSAFGPVSQSVGGSSMTTTSTGTYTPAWSLLLSTDWQSAALEIKALAAANTSGFFMVV